MSTVLLSSLCSVAVAMVIAIVLTMKRERGRGREQPNAKETDCFSLEHLTPLRDKLMKKKNAPKKRNTKRNSDRKITKKTKLRT